MRTARASPDLAKLTTADPRGEGGRPPGRGGGGGGRAEVAVRKSGDPFA